MSAFAAMLATIFADPNMAADAVYTPASGASVNCRVIFSEADIDIRGYETGATSPARIADVRASEVPDPNEGDTITIAGTTYTIDKATQPDSHRLIWRLELR